MSNWNKVGRWIKENAGTGAALVGSLLTGNVPGAVAAGASLVAGATGTDDPEKALQIFELNPEARVQLQRLFTENEQDVRMHLREVMRLEFEDAQKEHAETQKTIRAGDVAENWFVKFTRPGQSWTSLIAGVAYVFIAVEVNFEILALLLSPSLTYMGVRQIGKYNRLQVFKDVK